MTTAALTGASGFLGGNLAALLAEEGVAVRAIKRATSRTEHVADIPIEWLDAGLDDVEALARAFTGAEVVFHCAAVASQTRMPNGPHEATNVRGTANALAAAARAGVKRFVHVSSVTTCAIAAPGGPDVTEAERWNFADHGLDERYAVTKREAERLALAARDLDVVVVNPGLMIGPRDQKPSSGRLLLALARGQIVGATSGTSNFVDVRDVARGVVLAWHKGRRGERYILGGDNLPWSTAFALMSEELGRRAPRFVLPDQVVSLGGAIGDVAERLTGREQELNSAVAAYAVCAGYRFSSQKAERELGYRHGPVRDAVRDAIAWFRKRGML